MYLSIDAITDVSKADSLIKAQEMGLLCTKYQLSTLYYKLFLTLLTDSGDVLSEFSVRPNPRRGLAINGPETRACRMLQYYFSGYPIRFITFVLSE